MKINFNFDIKLSKKMLFLIIFIGAAVFELIYRNYMIIPRTSKDNSISSSTSRKIVEVKTFERVTIPDTKLLATKEKTSGSNKEISREFESAYKQAKKWAERSYMSKSRIYRTLIDKQGGGFDRDAADYAIDNLVWDFKENALRSAKDLAEYSNLSKRRIYLVLSGEDASAFTIEEAQYAIDNLDWDYKTNALKKAQYFLEETTISKNKIRDVLLNPEAEGFTEEEVDYAMSKLTE